MPNVSSAASVRPKTAPLLSFFTLQILNAARVPVASVSLTKAEPANRARARRAGRVIAAAYIACVASASAKARPVTAASPTCAPPPTSDSPVYLRMK